jgi:hypothetical protein
VGDCFVKQEPNGVVFCICARFSKHLLAFVFDLKVRITLDYRVRVIVVVSKF